mgnify:CR=1 FL=1
MSAEPLKEQLRRFYDVLRKPALRRVIGGLVLVLSFGYLGYVLASNWSDLRAYEWRVDYSKAALAFIWYSVALGFAVAGWTMMMGRLTSVTEPRKHLKYYVYTNLLKRLPGPLLDVFGRVYFYEREGLAGSLIVTISLLEWGVLILSGIGIYVLTLAFIPTLTGWGSPFIMFALLVVGVVLIRPKTLRSILRFVGKEDQLVSFGYRDLVLWLVIYGLVWTVGGLVLFAGINSLYTLSVRHLPAVVGIWVASGLISTLVRITPVGLGLKELTLSVLLGHLVPTPLAIVIALLMRVGITLFEIIWGIVVMNL